MSSAGLVCTATRAGWCDALAKRCTVPGATRTVSPGPAMMAPAPDAEPHPPFQHREALLLLGMGVAAGHPPARREFQFPDEHGVAGCGLADRDPFPAQRVDDDPRDAPGPGQGRLPVS